MKIAKIPVRAALGALVVGAVAYTATGSTTALWRDDATTPSFTITSGNLDLSDVAVTWADIADDVHATPLLLDGGADGTISTFRFVPGDQMRGAATFHVTVDGDNLQANLTLVDTTSSFSLVDADPSAPITQFITSKFRVVRGALTAAQPVPAGDVIAEGTLGTALSEPLIITGITADQDYTVVVDLDFGDIPDDEFDGAVARLTNLRFRLEQVR